MDKEELAEKILKFVGTQDGEISEEWYTTEREIATIVLSRFAEHIGLEVVIPDYIPIKTQKEILLKKQRKEIMQGLLPDIEKLFDLRYKEYMESKNEQPNQDLCGND